MCHHWQAGVGRGWREPPRRLVPSERVPLSQVMVRHLVAVQSSVEVLAVLVAVLLPPVALPSVALPVHWRHSLGLPLQAGLW